MARYTIKFRVWYAGGTTDEWTETISESDYHYYCDGSQGQNRLKSMAERRDSRGRSVNSVTMSLQHIDN